MKTPVIISIFVSLVLVSCGKGKDQEDKVLLKYGDRVLTLEEVEDKMPQGMTEVDSAALFKAIVESWIKDKVLSDFAEDQLYDTENIDRKVNDYRNSLIVEEYLSRKRESGNRSIDDQKVDEYYQLHSNEMKLEVPLVKGIFVKSGIDVSNKEELKRLITSEEAGDIDRFEQDWLDRTLEYTYFRDRWIDWETITEMIPYRFGDPDKFLKDHNYFETDYGDCTYYLQISDYIPSGEVQPIEYAQTWIKNILTQGLLADYETNLVKSLVDKAIKDKKLEMPGYDYKNHELKR